MAQPAHANTESRTSEATSHSETENEGPGAANQSGGAERSVKAAVASSARQSDDDRGEPHLSGRHDVHVFEKQGSILVGIHR
jgi:hypothetical protein